MTRGAYIWFASILGTWFNVVLWIPLDSIIISPEFPRKFKEIPWKSPQNWRNWWWSDVTIYQAYNDHLMTLKTFWRRPNFCHNLRIMVGHTSDETLARPTQPNSGTWIGKKKPRTMDKETKKCIALTTLLKTNQIAERSFTSINRIEVSWKLTDSTCQLRRILGRCLFLQGLYEYAFVEALFLTGGSRSFRGVRQLEFHQVCLASSKQSSIVRKLRFRKQTFPVTQCMICGYHLHTFWIKLQVNTPCILSVWHCEGSTRPVTPSFN